MIIEFIGVGEAFEPSLGNSSYLIKTETNLLVDCGYAVPRNFFEKKYPADFVDALYITHFHADHTFGIPALLNYWKEEKRKKPLTIIGQPGIKEHVILLLQMGYPGFPATKTYELEFIETTDPITFGDLSLSFAETRHSQKNYAIRIESGKKSVGISGDGSLTENAKKLYAECDMLIHDSFTFERPVIGHMTAVKLIEFARSLVNLEKLALVHLQRDDRTERYDDYYQLTREIPFDLFIAEPGQTIEL